MRLMRFNELLFLVTCLIVSQHADCLSLTSTVRSPRFLSLSVPVESFESVQVPISNATALPSNLSMGDLLAYETTSPTNGDLLVFLPGSAMTCDQYSDFLELCARDMYTLCLPYDNKVAIKIGCMLAKDESECWLRERLAAYDGNLHEIDHNNIHSRLSSALSYLSQKRSARWADYLDDAASPKWKSIRIGGHSQGAGHAAMIAYKNMVARVVQFSGPCDKSDWLKKMQPSKTPSSRFYSLSHAKDLVICDGQFRNFAREGTVGLKDMPALLNLRSGQAFRMGKQTVVSRMTPAHNASSLLMPHESIVLNGYWPEPNPYAERIWKFVVGL